MTTPFEASDSENIWHDMNLLAHVMCNGSKDQSTAVKLVAEAPRHTIHSTDFDLNVVSSYTWGTTSRVTQNIWAAPTYWM